MNVVGVLGQVASAGCCPRIVDNVISERPYTVFSDMDDTRLALHACAISAVARNGHIAAGAIERTLVGIPITIKCSGKHQPVIACERQTTHGVVDTVGGGESGQCAIRIVAAIGPINQATGSWIVIAVHRLHSIAIPSIIVSLPIGRIAQRGGCASAACHSNRRGQSGVLIAIGVPLAVGATCGVRQRGAVHLGRTRRVIHIHNKTLRFLILHLALRHSGALRKDFFCCSVEHNIVVARSNAGDVGSL